MISIGEDLKEGESLLTTGTKLRSQELGHLPLKELPKYLSIENL